MNVFTSLRRLRATWVKVYTRKMPDFSKTFEGGVHRRVAVPVKAAELLSMEVSAVFRTALDVGATTEQIHATMDEALQIAHQRNKAHFIRR
jgi:hypothetical protein